MRFAAEMVELIRRASSLGVECAPDGRVTGGFDWGWGETAYPPPGYLPWRAMEVGNGDTFGFYWPIGREDGPPVVCTLMHDEWSVLPLASGVAECVRLHLVTGVGEREEWLELAREAGVKVSDVTEIAASAAVEDEDDPDGLPYWGAFDVDQLLGLDPNSPHLRYLAAKRCVADRRLDRAAEHLGVALRWLPEYSEALGLLALVHRQLSRHGESAAAMMEAITSPMCFGAADRARMVGWLGRMKDSTYTGADPLWEMRAALAGPQGGWSGGGDDSAVNARMDELIEAYHAAGMGSRAVRTRLLRGEMMSRETVSLQEQAGWSGDSWRAELTRDLDRAGIRREI